MEFEHRITKKPVMYISETNLFPHVKSVLITDHWDMPDVDYSLLGIPHEIVEGQGTPGVRGWMMAFLDKGTKEFYLWFFASGFPDGKLPDCLV